jgi:hypothetical protein
MVATNIQVVTGSDAFILTSSNTDWDVNISNPSGNEFRLTITIAFEEYRQPSQPAGSLWLEYSLGTTTTSLPSIVAAVPVENPGPKNNYFVIVTRGNVDIHYTGQASMHVWLSYYAELPS